MNIPTLGSPRLAVCLTNHKPGYLKPSTAFWGTVSGREVLLIQHPHTARGRFEVVNSADRQTIHAGAVTAWREVY